MGQPPPLPPPPAISLGTKRANVGGWSGQRCAKFMFILCIFLSDVRFCVFCSHSFILYPFRFLCSYDFYRDIFGENIGCSRVFCLLKIGIHCRVALPWICWFLLLLLRVNILFISLLWVRNEKSFSCVFLFQFKVGDFLMFCWLFEKAFLQLTQSILALEYHQELHVGAAWTS